MELGLSLGEAPVKTMLGGEKASAKAGKGLGWGLGVGFGRRREDEMEEEEERESEGNERGEKVREAMEEGEEASMQLSLLLPLVPMPRHASPNLGFPWAPEMRNLEASTRGFDVNQTPSMDELEEGAALSSSPNSIVSSFQRATAATPTTRGEGELERALSRGSDEEENGLARKKLRLSKEQSAFLEESFKEHNTLNPKQKLALAKQLNLRPRQVEVWFQNRRARTKLKQTEVDCEYLKRCCETLTEENRRLQKELAELRALKTAHHFNMHLPATTLSMCPSCVRVVSTSSPSSSSAAAAAGRTVGAAGEHRPSSFAALFSKARFNPFTSQTPNPPSDSS